MIRGAAAPAPTTDRLRPGFIAFRRIPLSPEPSPAQAKFYDAAFTDFSQALASKSQSSLRPNDRAAIRSERALVLLKLDRSADARADVDEALRIAPGTHPPSPRWVVEEQSGRKSEAIAFYSRALAIKPDLEDAKRGLERLTPPKVETPLTTPEPAIESLKDDKRGLERLDLPGAIPLPDAQLADKSYKHSWARFWFLLAGACWVAMLFTLGRSVKKEPELEAPEMPHL